MKASGLGELVKLEAVAKSCLEALTCEMDGVGAVGKSTGSEDSAAKGSAASGSAEGSTAKGAVGSDGEGGGGVCDAASGQRRAARGVEGVEEEGIAAKESKATTSRGTRGTMAQPSLNPSSGDQHGLKPESPYVDAANKLLDFSPEANCSAGAGWGGGGGGVGAGGGDKAALLAIIRGPSGASVKGWGCGRYDVSADLWGTP